MGKKLFLRIETCMGCRSCELACAVSHSKSKQLLRAVVDKEACGYRVNLESYENTPVPIVCNHCEEAACLMACPTGAIHRTYETGPVLPDDSKCIGCSMCVQACPFGVISMTQDGKKALKCDLCIDLTNRGLKPACVAACPTRALLFTDMEESNRFKRKSAAQRMISAFRAAETEQKL